MTDTDHDFYSQASAHLASLVRYLQVALPAGDVLIMADAAALIRSELHARPVTIGLLSVLRWADHHARNGESADAYEMMMTIRNDLLRQRRIIAGERLRQAVNALPATDENVGADSPLFLKEAA